MDLDKNWYRGGVAAEVYDDLIRKERDLRCFSEYRGSRHVLKDRRQLVTWIMYIASSFDKCKMTSLFRSALITSRAVQLAIYLFDSYLHRSTVSSDEDSYLIAAVCIIIAAKFDVQLSNVPSPHILNQFIQRTVGRSYDAIKFRKCEFLILQSIDWRLHVPLPIDFVQYYVTAFETVDNFVTSRRMASPDVFTLPSLSSTSYQMCTPSPEPVEFESPLGDWKSTAEFLVDFSLKEINFRRFKPSLVTGSAVAAARSFHSLSPIWTKKLLSISGYAIQDLKPCYEFLIKFVRFECQINPNLFPESISNSIFDVSSESNVYLSGRLTVPPCLPTPAISPDLDYNNTSYDEAYPVPVIRQQSIGVPSCPPVEIVYNSAYSSYAPPPSVPYVMVSTNSVVAPCRQSTASHFVAANMPQLHFHGSMRQHYDQQQVSYGGYAQSTTTLIPESNLVCSSSASTTWNAATMPVLQILPQFAHKNNESSNRLVLIVKNPNDNGGYFRQSLPTYQQLPRQPTVNVATSTHRQSMIEVINLEPEDGVYASSNTNDEYQSCRLPQGGLRLQRHDHFQSGDLDEMRYYIPRPYTRSMKRQLGLFGSQLLEEQISTAQMNKRVRKK